jgi:carbohydrate diacid regulator
MISNQILQEAIDGIKSIAGVDLFVVDLDGKVIVETAPSINSYSDSSMEFAKSPADSQEIQGCQFFKIYNDEQLEYVLICTGAGENSYLVGKMAAFQLQGLVVAYKERFDKDNFIKNLLLDNMLLVDIYSRAKRLKVQTDTKRAVLLVETDSGKDNNSLELVREAVSYNKSAFATAVDETNVVIIKDLIENQDVEEVEACARYVVAYLKKHGVEGVRVAYGNPVEEIRDVSRSYKEAKMALDVGKIFFEEREVVAYCALGIGRLIFQIPLPLCRMFMNEIFGDKNPGELDEETLMTINKFFANSLNVSETSRQLFIHRNTLVYRLDKIQSATGLDLRVFDDAITFKIALMVFSYMKHMESIDY